jgi:hypothetical protein
VGIEISAEIASAYPDKRVTIVDRASALCENMPAKVARHVTGWYVRKYL